MSTIPFYHQGVGHNGLSRRVVLNQLINPTTQQFLLASGLKPGMRVLDVGCGIGVMSSWIAKIVGPEGYVLAIDNSPEQLEIARQIAIDADVPQLEFIEKSVGELITMKENFDFIYCRFLLIHLQNPYALIQTIYDHLEDDGVFACESAILGHEFCYPQVDAFNRWRELNHNIFKEMDKDPQTGKKLYSMMYDAGFRNLKGKIYQPVLTTQQQREEMLLNDLIEQQPAFISTGLSTAEEIEDLELELRDLVHDDSHFIAYSQSCQISGVK